MTRSRYQVVLRCALAGLAAVALDAAALTASLEAQQPDSVLAPAVGMVPSQPDPADSARRVLGTLTNVYEEAIVRRQAMMGSTGERRALAWVEIVALVDSLQGLKADMLDELNGLPATLPARDSLALAYQGLLQREFTLVEEGLRDRVEMVDSLRTLRTVTPVAELGDLETSIASADAQVDSTVAVVIRSLELADAAGIDVSEQRGRLDRALLSRAAEQTGRLQLALTEREDRLERLHRAERLEDADEVGDDVSALAARVVVDDQRVERLTESLATIADLLDMRGLPSAPYRQLVIEASGEISSDVLNPTVALGLLRSWSQRATRWFRERGPEALFRLVVLLISIILARLILRLAWRLFKRTRGKEHVSRLLSDLIDRLLKPIGIVVGVVAGLALLGFDVSTLLAGIGVAGVIVGFALQETLGNLAAGFFILANRPFDVDDRVTVAGVSGRVRAMGLASTTIVTFDNRRLSIPNNKVWREVIQNQSVERTRRVELSVPITYGEDPDGAIQAILDVCRSFELVLAEPAPAAFIDAFGDRSVTLVVHAWAANENWWTVRTELLRLIRLKFQEEGIETHFAQRIEVVRQAETDEETAEAQSTL